MVATIFPPYDFARALTEGTGAQVTMLIKPGVESHSFDPTPEDILTIAEADLFLCIGGHDEAWVDTVLEGQDRGPGRVVKLIGCVETLPRRGKGNTAMRRPGHRRAHMDLGGQRPADGPGHLPGPGGGGPGGGPGLPGQL